ncbi:MAG: tyrosine-type recombinase/integrase [Pseudobutyrivibrio sp.]|nr:tyrosine-type recombinase/integrase [Pseudobutyrivibrio sp.]
MEQHVNTLLSVYGEDLNRLRNRVGKDRSENTFRAMNMGRDYVERFLKERYGLDDIPIERLTPQFIQDFSIYLSADKGLRGGTVWLACQQLKGVVTRAYWRGDITWNPFAGFHIAKNIRPREYLTEEELERLITHHFDKLQLSYARDVFVFAAFTGLSYIDLKELRVSDIKDINGATWIVSQRHKTKVAYQVKLLDIPLRILHHYLKPGEERVFANMEYRMMAKRILTIMQEIGVTKHITMHCARHSFAVLALTKGMPIESVSRILGHTNITTTQIYAKITMQKLDADMDDLEKNLSDLSSRF